MPTPKANCVVKTTAAATNNQNKQKKGTEGCSKMCTCMKHKNNIAYHLHLVSVLLPSRSKLMSKAFMDPV